MTHAIVVEQLGGPEVLKWTDFDAGSPKTGEIRVRQFAAGVNFIDVYFRNGTYKAPRLPFVPGREGVGEIVEVGPEVTELSVGDRVAYGNAESTYAEDVVLPARQAVRVPDDIDSDIAAAVMLKGMTAEYLLRRTFAVKAGHTVLIHAAAGGVGLIAGQWAKHLGATVIGTAGSAEKCELARQHGYDRVINYADDNFVDRVLEITDGRKCDVVYDSVGQATYPASLDCIKPRGLFVSFGQSSGTIRNFDLALLNQKGSLYTTRPSLMGYNSTRAELDVSANALFDVIRSGAVKIRIGQRYALQDAQQAHRDLEGRRTTGISILTI